MKPWEIRRRLGGVFKRFSFFFISCCCFQNAFGLTERNASLRFEEDNGWSVDTARVTQPLHKWEVAALLNFRDQHAQYSGTQFIPTVLGKLEWNKNIFSGGIQLENFTMRSHQRPVFGLQYQRKFTLAQQELKGGLMWLENRYSVYTFARRFLVDIQSDQRKFKYRLGYHAVYFMITPAAKERLGLVEHTSLLEHNLIYELAYFLKENDSKWNLGFEIKNIDYLFVNQSSSPMFSGKFIHQPHTNWQFLAELRGQRPGMMNLSSDRLHVLFRLGAIWRARQ